MLCRDEIRTPQKSFCRHGKASIKEHKKMNTCRRFLQISMYWEPLLYFLKYYLFWNEEILASFLRSQMTFEQFSWGENRVKKNREKFTSLRLKCLRHLSIIFYTSSSRLPSFSLSPPETWSSFCDTDSSRKSITYAAAAPWREARVAPFQSIYRLEEKQHRILTSKKVLETLSSF